MGKKSKSYCTVLYCTKCYIDELQFKVEVLNLKDLLRWKAVERGSEARCDTSQDVGHMSCRRPARAFQPFVCGHIWRVIKILTPAITANDTDGVRHKLL